MQKQISGLLNTALLFVAIALQCTLLALDRGIKEGFEILDHLGSFLGGAAGLFAACVALLGFNIWKKQITHGKSLTHIWEAMVATQKLETHMAIASLNLVLRHQDDSGFFDEAIRHDRTESAKLLAELREACTVIDVIAARNGVELTNRCAFWESRLQNINSFADNPGDLAARDSLVAWTDELRTRMEHADGEGKALRRALEKLERRFS